MIPRTKAKLPATRIPARSTTNGKVIFFLLMYSRMKAMTIRALPCSCTYGLLPMRYISPMEVNSAHNLKGMNLFIRTIHKPNEINIKALAVARYTKTFAFSFRSVLSSRQKVPGMAYSITRNLMILPIPVPFLIAITAENKRNTI